MTRDVWIVFDLGFGDAGKGATVDFLVRDRGAGLVVRYNGGAQAGHNVVTPNGRHHTFAQFGSGTFVPGVRTLLGPAFILHPGALLVESRRLESLGIDDPLSRLSIDRRALVVSPFQQAAGRLREIQRGASAHGTCGVGIGEAVGDSLAHPADAIHAADFQSVDAIRLKLESQRDRKQREFTVAESLDDRRVRPEIELLHDPGAVDRVLDLWRPLTARLHVLDSEATDKLIRKTETVIFEGAQGVLLDQDHGFHPHTTWSDCTPRGALALLDDTEARVTRLGVLRVYMVRHGSGPFPTHEPEYDRLIPEPHNGAFGWQGSFRRGPLDLVLLRYALETSGGADGLALTWLDMLPDPLAVCSAYRLDGRTLSRLPVPRGGDHDALFRLGLDLQRVEPILHFVPRECLPQAIAEQTGIPVSLVASGPTAVDRHWRPN